MRRRSSLYCIHGERPHECTRMRTRGMKKRCQAVAALSPAPPPVWWGDSGALSRVQMTFEAVQVIDNREMLRAPYPRCMPARSGLRGVSVYERAGAGGGEVYKKPAHVAHTSLHASLFLFTFIALLNPPGSGRQDVRRMLGTNHHGEATMDRLERRHGVQRGVMPVYTFSIAMLLYEERGGFARKIHLMERLPPSRLSCL